MNAAESDGAVRSDLLVFSLAERMSSAETQSPSSLTTDHTLVLRRDFTRREFVHVAPDPGFAGLNGPNERVLGAMEMFGRVLVLG
jgi:hypothetical protein